MKTKKTLTQVVALATFSEITIDIIFVIHYFW